MALRQSERDRRLQLAQADLRDVVAQWERANPDLTLIEALGILQHVLNGLMTLGLSTLQRREREE